MDLLIRSTSNQKVSFEMRLGGTDRQVTASLNGVLQNKTRLLNTCLRFTQLH